MTTLTQGKVALQFLLNEGDRGYSRDDIVIASGAGKLSAGTVLGKVVAPSVGTPTFAGTGNGVMTKASPAYGAGVQNGSYKAVFIDPTTNAGEFEVIRPDGTVDGVGTVGVAYTGQVKFTIADGATDFVQNDTFTIPVTAAGTKYIANDPAATDGSQVASAVLAYNVDATSADVNTIGIMRNAEVKKDELVYSAGIGSDATKIATANAQLGAVGVIVR